MNDHTKYINCDKPSTKNVMPSKAVLNTLHSFKYAPVFQLADHTQSSNGMQQHDVRCYTTVQTQASSHLCVGESVLHVHLAACVLSYSSQAPGVLTGQLSQLIIARPDLGVPLRQLPTVRSLLKRTNTYTSWHTLMKCQIRDRCRMHTLPNL